MVAWLYATDTPTNLFPSIHVYNSLGVHIAICNSKEFKERPKLKLASFILMVSIILATMFLKQHSVFDVVTAFVMAAVMYSFVYGRNFAFGRSKAKESDVYKRQSHARSEVFYLPAQSAVLYPVRTGG